MRLKTSEFVGVGCFCPWTLDIKDLDFPASQIQVSLQNLQILVYLDYL